MHMKVWAMVLVLLAFAHPYPIIPPHAQLFQVPINHFYNDVSWLPTTKWVIFGYLGWRFITTLYYLLNCNNKRIICNIQHPNWMILVTPWSRLMVCIPKLSIPIIGHEHPAHVHFFYWHLESSNNECLHIGQPHYLKQRHMNPIHNYQWFTHKHTYLDLELMHLCRDMHLMPSPK
jgi:hypothetical protein